MNHSVHYVNFFTSKNFIIHFHSVEKPVGNVQNLHIAVNNLETNYKPMHF